MLNTWVLQSFLNLIQDIQLNELITDVKTSLLTKWQLPKFDHVEKKEFLLSIIVHIQKFGKQIILQKLHLHYQKVTVSLPFSLIKSLHICAPDLIFTSNYKYTWTGTYACILHNSGILLVDNAFENDHIVHLIHAYKHTCKLYTVVNLWP